MNFIEKGNSSSHGEYYHHHHHHHHGDNITTTTPTGTEAAELDLMDSSPVHHHHHHHSNNNDEKERGGGGGGLGLGTGGDAMMVMEKEHMFDKVVTPSDVGKLNRLVIPKQHAEKYFPLDSSTNDKGLLLNFEDNNGKSWRFRYSYWNSSQSYVMTKGWSRFVKDKKLDPGDIVSFHRGKDHLAKDRLFIDWRRRPDHLPPDPMAFTSNHTLSLHPPRQFYFPTATTIPPVGAGVGAGWGSSTGPPPSARGLFLPAHATTALRVGGDHYYLPGQTPNYSTGYGNYARSNATPGLTYTSNRGGGSHHVLNNPNHPSGNSVIYFRPAASAPHHHQQASLETGMMHFPPIGGGGGVDQEVLLQSVPVVQGKAAAKRLRLFGVNMDCPISDDEEEEEDDEEHDHINILPSTTVGHHPHSLMVSPPPHLVQLRLYNNRTSSSPQQLPHHHHQMQQFQSDYDKGKGIQ